MIKKQKSLEKKQRKNEEGFKLVFCRVVEGEEFVVLCEKDDTYSKFFF